MSQHSTDAALSLPSGWQPVCVPLPRDVKQPHTDGLAAEAHSPELRCFLGAATALHGKWSSLVTAADACAAQHLLSAVADVVTGADTASWELRVPSPDGAADAVLVELETDALYSEQVSSGEVPTDLNVYVRMKERVGDLGLRGSGP